MKTPQKIIAVAVVWISSILISSGGMEESMKDFLKAYTAANEQDMSAHYAESIKFLGDSKFLGKQEPMVDPVALTKGELSKNYERLFNLVGKDKWVKLVSSLKPSIQISKEGGEYKGIVKKGDIIYDLHFREALQGKRRGLDEAVIFIFRKVGDKYLVVGHIADY